MALHRSDVERRAHYRDAATRLHGHLDHMLSEDGYPTQVTWGYAMTLLFSIQVGQRIPTVLGRKARECLDRQDMAAPNFSWEFVVMAVQKAKRLCADPSFDVPLDVHRAKGTRMFNWFLLRQLNRGWFEASNEHWTLAKLRVARRLFTRSDGLILDEWRTRSLQYHAFCLYLLCELVEQHPRAGFLVDWLISGVRFSLQHVLRDGTAMWLGRGQEQIFGYGALAYACEFVHANIEPLPLDTLSSIQQRLLRFQREDGGFPLVLRQRDPEVPWPDNRLLPPGWYGYNTLGDYLPFLGHTLFAASQLSGGLYARRSD